ncbi:hypothetical protein VPH35_021402 [Triticum aestivum]
MAGDALPSLLIRLRCARSGHHLHPSRRPWPVMEQAAPLWYRLRRRPSPTASSCWCCLSSSSGLPPMAFPMCYVSSQAAEPTTAPWPLFGSPPASKPAQEARSSHGEPPACACAVHGPSRCSAAGVRAA